MIRTRAVGDTRAIAHVPRRVVECVVLGLWLALAVLWELTCPLDDEGDGLVRRTVTCAAFLMAVGYLLTGVRRGPARELREARAVARATQDVLLRPLPPSIDGLTLAARRLSVSQGADVGGDLYEAVATPYGVRIVIGDVRGHGLPAIGAVAAVLGSFREAAYDEAALDGVLRRLDRAYQRRLRDLARQEHPAGGGREPENPAAEEFVTVLLLEIGADSDVRALNCGHPWPFRLGQGAAVPLTAGEPLPPLGAFPLPDDLAPHLCGRLPPGEALFLHTDGAEDARDAAGRFFGLQDALVRTLSGQPPGVPVSPAHVARQVHTALLRHTGGRITDDVALLVLRNDRGARGDRARVPAQSGEPALRRARSEPSRR
ncbi:PP2C family protein-serine/threonine phosphatase [Streptomyces liangshanensis]|uniref:Serine/threonine-protein phosphatase n=1 Tax=Streptomyces liangshanensis TaxID=2717324 RepID=A0A6G9H550_9ACTN|nr:PP2C family protein-serine/threonine phosphatase [Streptomyces liangshanensis]QIQ05668.1 serine/threonine-protein phosphatase [Streptomyces liangshanensis]